MSVPDDAHFSMMVFRIGIPDLHQTVSHSPLAGGWGAGDRGHQSARGAGKGMGPPVLDDLTRGPHCQTPMGFPPALLCPGNHPQPSQTCSGPFSLSWRLPHQKCLRFNPDATIWTAKQQVLCALSESLQDVLNYGLFQPATSGRDANFLEEERLLREYPQSFEKGVPYLEVRPPRPSQSLHRCKQASARSPFLHPAQTSARESPVGSSGYKGHPKNPRASLVAQRVKNLPAMQETPLGWEDLLEKVMATHSSILAWRIPRTEEPGRLQSVGVTKSRTRLSD